MSNENEKIICYANIGSFNSPKGVTDEDMVRFFRVALGSRAENIINIVVDRENPYTQNCFYRKGFNEVINSIRNGNANLLVIPSVTMVSENYMTVMQLLYDLQRGHNCNTEFLCEEINTVDEKWTEKYSFYEIAQSTIKKIKAKKRKMLAQFSSVNNLSEKTSTVPFEIDYDSYRQVECFAKINGLTFEGVLYRVFEAVTIPEFERHLKIILELEEEDED